MSGWEQTSVLNTSKPTISLKRGTETSSTHGNRSKKIKPFPKESTWAERFEPQTRNDLAIHKKKVDEVDQWLKNNITDTDFNAGKAPILLIVGPTGSGKSITLKVLAKENEMYVKEWIHPLTVGADEYVEDGWKFVGRNEVPKEKVTDNFTEFLFQGSRYKSLFEDATRRIIVLEDIPSVFLKHTEDFHQCLRKYRKFGRCPLVILLCETSSSREFKLFPPALKTELGIHSISFNPVAVTLLTKALKCVIHQANSVFGGSFNRVTEAEVESVIHGCDGDLRLAVNLLEVASMGKSKILNNFNIKKKHAKEEKPRVAVKDSSLFIFHSLGKILYAKREEKVTHVLSTHLKSLEKPALKENPEDVFDRTCVSQDIFVEMLHNNASHFYGTIESAANCLEWFSIGDYLVSEWDPTGAMNSLGLSATLRGLMFHLEKSKSKTHFGTFKKPSFDKKKVRCRLEKMRYEFRIEGVSTDILVKDLLPYYFKIRPKALSEEQWIVINDCVLVKGTICQLRGIETIDEKFVPEEDEDTVGSVVENNSALTEFTPTDTIEIEEINSD